jgi:hypothetical protein
VSNLALEEIIVKNSFIFYRSFSEAIDNLPEDEQLQIYRAIKEYALNGIETELSSGTAKGFFVLIKPQLEANNKKYRNGLKGGRKNQEPGLFQDGTKREPNGNQDGTKQEPNGNQDGTKQEPNGNQDGTKQEPNGNQDGTKQEPNENENENENVNVNENVNENVNAGDSASPKQRFLYRWKHTGNIFSIFSAVENPKGWAAFWEDCPFSVKQIDECFDNFINAVESGEIERRFIPSTPDRFVLKGWLQKSLLPFGKKTKPGTSPPENVVRKKSLGGLESWG